MHLCPGDCFKRKLGFPSLCVERNTSPRVRGEAETA